MPFLPTSAELQHGFRRLYDESGALKNEAYWKEGKLLSEDIYFDNKIITHKNYAINTGKLDVEINYKNGKRHGLSKRYFGNGNLNEEEYSVDGLPNGVWKHYYYNSGKLEAVGENKNAVENGAGIRYWENGNIMQKWFWYNAFENGWFKDYYKNGNLEQEYERKNGEIVNLKRYDESGKLVDHPIKEEEVTPEKR